MALTTSTVTGELVTIGVGAKVFLQQARVLPPRAMCPLSVLGKEAVATLVLVPGRLLMATAYRTGELGGVTLASVNGH